jgi:hypothetical protein
MRRRKSSVQSDLLRLFCFVVGTFCSLYAIRSVHSGKLDVAVGPHRNNVVVTPVSDPVMFWGIVLLFSLFAGALFYAAFFAKDKPNA